MLGRDLTIRRFSAQAEKQFNLLAADVGRPISHVRHDLDLPDLDTLIARVIDTVREQEREVQDTAGRWFLLRVRPYISSTIRSTARSWSWSTSTRSSARSRRRSSRASTPTTSSTRCANRCWSWTLSCVSNA